MTDITPVVGYSTNDFYYTNPVFCQTLPSGEYKKYDATGNSLSNDPEKAYDGSETIVNDNACGANDFYGKKVQELSAQSHTTSSKYNDSLIVYNRELLRTVNYLAGIGALAVYMYMNR